MVVAAALLLLLLSAGAPQPLPAPVEATPTDIALAPSAAVRAATLARMASPPPRPVTVRLACEIGLSTGEPLRCLPAAMLREVGTWEAFRTAAASFERSLEEPGADAALRAAYERARTMRMRSGWPDRAPGRRVMLLTQIIAASDALAALPPTESLSPGDVTVEETGPLTQTELYPEQALRNDEQATVAVTCRVQPDRALLCRNGEAVWPATIAPATARLFVLATYQVMSLRRLAPLTRDGRPVVGRDLVFRVGWRLQGI